MCTKNFASILIAKINRNPIKFNETSLYSFNFEKKNTNCFFSSLREIAFFFNITNAFTPMSSLKANNELLNEIN